MALKTKHTGGVAGAGGGGLAGLERLFAATPLPGSPAPPSPAELVAALADFYAAHGIAPDRRHLEVAVAALRRWRVTDAGDTDLVPGEVVTPVALAAANRRAARPATADAVLVGAATAAKTSDSFLASAAFERTRDALRAAALAGRSDPLWGPRECLIAGRVGPGEPS